MTELTNESTESLEKKCKESESMVQPNNSDPFTRNSKVWRLIQEDLGIDK